MYKKYTEMVLPYFLLFNVLVIHGCSTSTTSRLMASSQSASTVKVVPDGSQHLTSSSTPDPDSVRVAGSKTPDQWIYSRDKAVACRIKQWSSYPMETHIDLEFTNFAKQKPVNIVYTLIAKDSGGETIHLFNEYTDKQTNITDFNPPLNRGETKTVNFLKKYIASFSVELKECRIAQKNENFLTINPEMKGYQGP